MKQCGLRPWEIRILVEDVDENCAEDERGMRCPLRWFH